MNKILLVDDDPAILEVLCLRLGKWGYEVVAVDSGRKALECLESERPDILLSDVVMPGCSGLELLAAVQNGKRTCPVILVTAHGQVNVAVRAMKQGAQDFVTKPIDYSHLKAALDEACETLRLQKISRRLASQVRGKGRFGRFVGRSKPMRKVHDLISRVAGTDASVLISGGSGTGKELAARTLHEMSRRAGGPFFPVNAAAIPSELIESQLFGHEKGAFTGATESSQGCFELADGGTLFLDEIGEMPVSLQTRLLRVLEEGSVRRLGGKTAVKFDVRIITATNQNPLQAVKKGSLREDLFYRLNVFSIELPLLRERRADIPLLVRHFLDTFNQRHGTSVEGIRDDVKKFLMNYHWPGNVRELKNVMERAVVLGRDGWIEVPHLPRYIREGGTFSDREITFRTGTSLAEVERELILKTLEAANRNKAETARMLGVDVKTIRNKLKSYEQGL